MIMPVTVPVGIYIVQGFLLCLCWVIHIKRFCLKNFARTAFHDWPRSGADVPVYFNTHTGAEEHWIMLNFYVFYYG